MRYIAVLDRQNLSNSLFVTKFAETLRNHSNSYSVVLHADSYYTDSLIQTGMMREDAETRCTKELNRRLVAVMADEGVATIALNGYQRDTISYDGTTLDIRTEYLNSLPESPVLMLSNLARDKKGDTICPVPLPMLANRLATILDLDEIIVFSDMTEKEKENLTPPAEFQSADFVYRTINLTTFKGVNEISKVKISNS